MTRKPPRKDSPRAGWLSAGLWLSLGVLLGLAAGFGIGKIAFPAKTAQEAGESTGATSPDAYLSADYFSAETTKNPDVKPIPVTGSLFEALQAEAAKMSQAERLAELKRMAEEDIKPQPNHSYYYRSWDDHRLNRYIQYMALIQKEDLPFVRQMLEEQGRVQGGRAHTMRSSCLTAWGMLDPDGLETWVKERTLDFRNRYMGEDIRAMANCWTRLDASQAWDKLKAFDQELSGRATMNDGAYWVRAIMQKLSKESPQGAYNQALSLQNPAIRKSALANVLSDLAQTDFHKAMEMAAGLPNRNEAVNIEGEVLQNLSYSKGKFLEATEYVLASDSKKLADRYLSNLIGNWAQQDNEGFRAWNEANPDKLKEFNIDWEEYKDRSNKEKPQTSEERIAAALAETDEKKRDQKLSEAYSNFIQVRLEDALQAMKTLDEETLTKVGPNMIQHLGQYDPDRAAELINTLPEKARVNALQNLMGNWVGLDARAASEWLDRQPAGPAKDGGISALIYSIQSSDPEAASQWALQITDENNQRNQLNQSLREWARQDKGTALDWAKRQNIPEKTREYLLKQLES